MADDQMADAIAVQLRHATVSQIRARVGWTRQQWIDDAREQFEHLDGSVLDLVNGHVSALLAEVDDLREAAREAERQGYKRGYADSREGLQERPNAGGA